MSKNYFKIVLIIVCCFCLLFLINIIHYIQVQQKILENNNCYQGFLDNLEDKKLKNNCYVKAYEQLLPYLLVSETKKDSKKLDFVLLEPNYIIPDICLKEADALIGYGVFNDMFAEEQFSKKYNKPSYAFDCGIPDFEIIDERCHFESSCIGTDKFILKEENQVSSGNIHTFGQKLKELGLENKKVFIKMDIAGAAQDILPDIIKYHKKITGLSVCFHFESYNDVIKARKVLKEMQKDFVLIARSHHILGFSSGKTSPFIKGNFAALVTLSYINKNLVDSSCIKWHQEDILVDEANIKNGKYYTSLFSSDDLLKYGKRYVLPRFKINKTVVLVEKVKNFFYQEKE